MSLPHPHTEGLTPAGAALAPKLHQPPGGGLQSGVGCRGGWAAERALPGDVRKAQEEGHSRPPLAAPFQGVVGSPWVGVLSVSE